MNTRDIAGLCAGLVLLTSSTVACAQPGDSADELLRDASAVARNIDDGKLTDVWDNAASFVKQRNSEAEFVGQLRQQRDKVGQVHRSWGSVVRIRYKGAKDIPDGLYANVDYVSDKVGGGTVYEKLSFRLEDDGQWHLTGYAPRDSRGNGF